MKKYYLSEHSSDQNTIGTVCKHKIIAIDVMSLESTYITPFKGMNVRKIYLLNIILTQCLAS